MTAAATEPDPKLAERLTLGTAPDSWGVWFPEDEFQVTWKAFLDEVVEAGYRYIEQGPFGFLPKDPELLKDEIGGRGLTLVGGTQFMALHNPGGFDAAISETHEIASQLTALGARYLILLPQLYRGEKGGDFLEPATLTDEQWDRLSFDSDRVGKILAEEYGIALVMHPHGDAHVDGYENTARYLDGTDPRYVNLCLDTGHFSYCGGDNLQMIRNYAERVTYVHLKQVDPAIVDRVNTEGLSLGEAVKLGVMCEPPTGIPEMPAIIDTLADLDRDIYCVVEQDLYPCAADVPLPIAVRTREYLNSCGLGPVPKR